MIHQLKLSLPKKYTSDLRVCMVEPGEPQNRGSMGCQYVMNAARSAGFIVNYILPEDDSRDFDVELVSLHHCNDFLSLARLPRHGRIRIVGGHPSANNIRPAIPFGDVFCIGEGEEWIVQALTAIAGGATDLDMANLPGTIVRRLWSKGDAIPQINTVSPIPQHPPYLNRGGEGHARVWYLEMARGCPFSCHYCELGWAWKYRPQATDYLLEAIDSIDTGMSNRISLFAPDEASHPGYAEILERIHSRRMITSFGSMRLDMIVRKNLPFKRNMLIRVGLDGLTEATRLRVNKRIMDDDVLKYFEYMTERGHTNFKIFMVFGYEWEKLEDLEEWISLWDKISNIERAQNAYVRIKFTPFIPQPSTPLGACKPHYDPEMALAINEWFAGVKSPRRRPGWFVQNDGIMSERNHRLQCLLTSGDEDTLNRSGLRAKIETLRGYEIW